MILIAYFMLCILMIKSHGSFFKDDIQSYISDDGFEGENFGFFVSSDSIYLFRGFECPNRGT